MPIDTIIGLMRMAQDGNKAIANLAKLILSMVDSVRDLETRAGLAEAALEAERAKVAELQATIRLRDRAGALPAAELAMA